MSCSVGDVFRSTRHGTLEDVSSGPCRLCRGNEGDDLHFAQGVDFEEGEMVVVLCMVSSKYIAVSVSNKIMITKIEIDEKLDRFVKVGPKT